MSTGLLLPEQGSQKLGILANIPEIHMERLENVTGYRLVGREEDYQDTAFIQLALLTKAVSYLDEMEKNDTQPDIVTERSIGAFCVAVTRRSLTFESAAELVYHRAVLMKEAYPSGYVTSVVVGVTRSEAEEVVAKTFDPDHPVYLSNENCPMQHTLSGSIEGLSVTLAEVKRHQTQTTKLLKTPMPPHYLLINDTVKGFKPYMQSVHLSDARYLYIKNTSGRATQDVEGIREDLLKNLVFPVQWNQMMDLTKELGMDLTIEFPLGDTLTKLIHTKSGVNKRIRMVNLDQHDIGNATPLYQKWR